MLSTFGELAVDAAITSAMKPATQQYMAVTANPQSWAIAFRQM